MNAKEKQIEVINSYLKPTLKSYGYKLNGQTWWKDKGDFFDIINLQNFSWNSKDKVDFCFNIGVSLKATMKDIEKKKPSFYDKGISAREGFFMSEKRKTHEFRNEVGYMLDDKTDFSNFVIEFRNDFENDILPYLDNLKSLKDCLEKFESLVFFGEIFKKAVAENYDI